MKNTIVFILAFILAFNTSMSAVAQSKNGSQVSQSLSGIEQKTVTGTVLDEDGEPLPGATVLIEGTQEMVLTDVDGNFVILVKNPNATLLVSFIGMETAKITLEKDFKYLHVTLHPAYNIMDEVVVTGYQDFKREDVTGALQVLTANDMDKSYIGDITANLEGKIPGLVVDPKKNGEDAITIRGVGTFEANTAPLVVVDGLPIEGGLNTVNPYDIGNITILKDAAAVAIYGARASNGVIVITSKRANASKASVDINYDLIISEKQNYNNYGWASSAELIQLERYNFEAMMRDAPQALEDNLKYLENNYNIRSLSPVMRLLLQNYSGALSDTDLEAILSRWSENDYRKEWQEAHDRNRITNQVNAAIRIPGKTLQSNIVLNYAHDNMGVVGENDHSYSIKYNGDWKPLPWFNLSLGINVLNDRTNTHPYDEYGSMNSFLVYESMYNEDGSRRGLEAAIYPGEEVFNNQDYGLKEPTYNLLDELERNSQKNRYTNIRTYANAIFNLPVEGWTVQGQFQYEDIFQRSDTQYDAESYTMRSLYDLYTYIDPATGEVIHAIPEGGFRQLGTTQRQYYTARAQTRYNHTFAGKHDIDVLAGVEARQTHSTYDNSMLYGYDHDTQTNLNLLTDWAFINNPTTGVLGSNYTPYGAFSQFSTTDVEHRFFSYYFTANYVYDRRYGISGSYRVDQADLFGADPKFRTRPLWSVGLSWNAHHENFLKAVSWLNVLKVRASYGLTGNIDSSVSSYLTATIGTNFINGDKSGSLNTPPNDQLRWEKTASWNAGLDFAFLDYRLSGSIDFYRKNSSDLLTNADLDPTTGWSSLKINSGCMINQGIELQINGQILRPTSRRSVGIDMSFNFAYNHNEVTKVSHYARSGSEYLSMQLHEGYPINSLFSIYYAGLVEKNGVYYVGWLDTNKEVHTENISSGAFTVEDALFSGTYTPVYTGAITPEISFYGFSISAMFNYYAGHYMRVDNDAMGANVGSGAGYTNSFGMGAYYSDHLYYWEGGEGKVPANGYFSNIKNGNGLNGLNLRHTNVVPADYLKLRNIVLSYEFDPKICRKIHMYNLRLRVQMNDVWTWVRNDQGIDPEAINMINGITIDAIPSSYTMSISFNF